MEKKGEKSELVKTQKTGSKFVKVLPIQKTAFLSEKDIAADFATKVHQKFASLIKASILFGSQAKKEATTGSDIDIILIIDDASINWDLELVAWYREELGKIIENNEYNRELHINTVKLTTWWQDILYGDPVVINVLRYGEAIIDSGGFFNPLKALLLKGKIRSTPEAVYAALQRAPEHLARSRASTQAAIEGVYWAIIDSAQAALMTAGKLPPSPEHIPELLHQTFVDSGMMKSEYVKIARDIYAMHKSILHGTHHSIRGSEIEEWQKISEKFVGEMTRLIDILIEHKK